MASIEKYETRIGERRWMVRYRKPDHSLTTKRGFVLKKDAVDWAAENTTRLNDGTFVDPTLGKTRVDVLWGKYLAAHEGVWKPSNTKPVESAWRNHVGPRWASREIASIRRSEVQTWVSEMTASGKSPTLVLRCFGIVKGIFGLAVDDGYIRSLTPVQKLQLPKKPSRKEDRHYLTPVQLVALAALCGEHRLLVLVLGFCGLRWGEAAGLRKRDVDLKKGKLHIRHTITKVGSEYVEGVPKSWEQRDVPIPGKLAPLLKHAIRDLEPDSLVFTDADGHSIRPQSVGKKAHGWWARALEAAGLEPMTCHDLRHTAASIAVSSGVNVKALQRMLGHKSAAMTLDTYADLFDSDLDMVAVRISERMPEVEVVA